MTVSVPQWAEGSPPTRQAVSQWTTCDVHDAARDLVLFQSGRRAAKRFSIAEVLWDLRGLCAGQALVKPMRVRLNQELLKMPDDGYRALSDTVLHEVAHLAAIAINPRRGRGHGSLWEGIAIQLGCVPKRCHTLPLKRHRILREYAYELPGRRIWLGPRQHAALQRGARYLCRHTGEVIRPMHFSGVVREER